MKANWRKQMAPLSEARHRSHRSRDASGQADPSLEPSEHYRRGLTVSTGGQQRGQMCIFQCNDYPFFWCHVFVFVHGLVLLRPAWRLNGGNKAGLGSSHCRWRRNWRYSCPCLVVDYTEELISRTFLDENRFRLVSQDRMSA